MYHKESASGHYPDGLSEDLIDALITEAFAAVEPVRRMASPFVDHPADVRRERRRRNREITELAKLCDPYALVAGLPSHGKAVPRTTLTVENEAA